MNPLLMLHIAGGSVALAAGTAAVAATKGGALHARAGTFFSAAMLLLGGTASLLAAFNDKPDTPLGGLFTCYLVATAWVTARRRDGCAGRFEVAAGAVALVTGAAMVWMALEGAVTPAGRYPIFAFAALSILSGLLDLSVVVRGRLTPPQRLARHVWRMCFAFFIATGSFFLGQQQVMPSLLRDSPVILALALAPLATMLFWLVRLRLPKARGRFAPATAEA